MLFNRISIDPAGESETVVAIVVVDETGFGVKVLAAELERIVAAAGMRHTAEGGVVIGVRDYAGGIAQFDDVLVTVGNDVFIDTVRRPHQRYIQAHRLPEVVRQQRVAVQRVEFRDQLIAVVDKLAVFVKAPVQTQQTLVVDLLPDAPPHVVVVALDLDVVGFRFHQPVFGVVGVSPVAMGQHVAVGVVGRHGGVHQRVLIDEIRRVAGRSGVLNRAGPVADLIVEIGH
ncbi:hypothetical protein SDC9_115544 [bioreactor metagenome]|uniref:Uncharacterized protein n=1 Tax=bioreactor metagenome TaxID=1076179 RepID=A0A645BT56_9ZZZZ